MLASAVELLSLIRGLPRPVSAAIILGLMGIAGIALIRIPPQHLIDLIRGGGSREAPGAPPAEARYRFQQGLALAANGRIDESIREFSDAINLAPNYAAAYGNRGVAYMMQKKYNKAHEDLIKAIALDPADKTAFYNLAAVHALRQEWDLSLDRLDQALKLGFDDYDVLRRDPDLDAVRKLPEFRKVLERHKIVP